MVFYLVLKLKKPHFIFFVALTKTNFVFELVFEFLLCMNILFCHCLLIYLCTLYLSRILKNSVLNILFVFIVSGILRSRRDKAKTKKSKKKKDGEIADNIKEERTQR